VYGYIKLVLQIWPASELKRQVGAFTFCLTKGQSDADAEVRKKSRAGYWAFEENFSKEASTIMAKLDPSKQKQLMKDKDAGSTTDNPPPKRAAAPSRPVQSAVSQAKAKAKKELALAEAAAAEADLAAKQEAKKKVRRSLFPS
jgi:hypothetical protein